MWKNVAGNLPEEVLEPYLVADLGPQDEKEERYFRNKINKGTEMLR